MELPGTIHDRKRFTADDVSSDSEDEGFAYLAKGKDRKEKMRELERIRNLRSQNTGECASDASDEDVDKLGSPPAASMGIRVGSSPGSASRADRLAKRQRGQGLAGAGQNVEGEEDCGEDAEDPELRTRRAALEASKAELNMTRSEWNIDDSDDDDCEEVAGPSSSTGGFNVGSPSGRKAGRMTERSAFVAAGQKLFVRCEGQEPVLLLCEWDAPLCNGFTAKAAETLGMLVDRIYLLQEGTPISLTRSPRDLGLQSGECLYAEERQTPILALQLRYGAEAVQKMHFSMTTTFGSILQAFCAAGHCPGLSPAQLQLTFDGDNLDPLQTLDACDDIETDDLLDVVRR